MTPTNDISNAAATLGRKGGRSTTTAKATAAQANGTKSAWRFKVVKKQRDGKGEWFAYPAATFPDQEAAITFASAFAKEQAGVGGTRIVVLNRGNQFVHEIRI